MSQPPLKDGDWRLNFELDAVPQKGHPDFQNAMRRLAMLTGTHEIIPETTATKGTATATATASKGTATKATAIVSGWV